MKRSVQIVTTILTLVTLLGGCNKDNGNSPSKVNTGAKQSSSSGPVTVSSIYPTSGITYTAITITGNNFDTAKTNNVVKINGVAALVNSATATQLVVTVLPGITTGTVTVTTNGNNASAPTAFKVVHMVKIGSLNQPANPIIALAFDKSGNTYGIQTLVSSNHCAVIKYANGSLITLYKTPNDTITNGINGYHNKYTYNFGGLATDSKGNVYTGLVQRNESYSVDSSMTDSYGSLNNKLVYTTSILKITPGGVVTVLADSVNAQPFANVNALAIDGNDNIFIGVDNVNKQQSICYIDKITATGQTSVFYTGAQVFSIAIDKSNNIYACLQQAQMARFTPQGAISTFGGNIGSPGTFTSINFDPFNNLIVTNSWFVFLINSAGYSTNNIYAPNRNITQYKLSFDNSGNVYNITRPSQYYNVPNAITKYSYQ